MSYAKLKVCWQIPAIVNLYLTRMQANSLPVMNSFSPTSRMLRGFARSGAEVVLISSRSETLEAPTKRWLKDFGVDYDWLHLVPNSTSYEKHIKRTLAEHKGDLLIAALVHDPRLRAALADSHHRPVIYEVSK